MEILQVSLKYDRSVASGSAKVAYDISQELAKRGHSVTVFTSDMTDNHTKVRRFEKEEGVSVYRFQTIGAVATMKLKTLVTPAIVMKLRNDIRLYDVIHLHEYYSFQNIVVHYFAKRYGVPYILQAHGSIPRIGKRHLKWLYDISFGRILLKDASKVIALSDIEAKQYRSVGVPKGKIEIVPNGIDLSNYSDLPRNGEFKDRYGIEKEKKIILFLGRIIRLKGIEFLIDAFVYMIRNLKYDNALLVLAGPDDGYLNETRNLVKRHEIQSRVLFTGALYGWDKLEAYVDADVYVLPSEYEIWGLTLFEAAACSTPVIFTSGNAVSEVVREGGFGFSVRYGDVVELAESMHKMLVNDTLSKEMGREGRKFVFENYDWAKIVPKIEKVYEETSSTARK